MASLSNSKTVKQLKSNAFERGIDYQGLKKAEIIDKLVSYDETEPDEVEDKVEEEVVVVSKTVATSHSVSKGIVEADTESPSIALSAGDSEQMKLLKLQVQIAEAIRVTEETKLKQI